MGNTIQQKVPGFRWVTKGEKGVGVEPNVINQEDKQSKTSGWIGRNYNQLVTIVALVLIVPLLYLGEYLTGLPVVQLMLIYIIGLLLRLQPTKYPAWNKENTE